MLVIASMPWSSVFLSMMSTRSSRAFHAFARARMSSSSASVADRQAEVVEARARHRAASSAMRNTNCSMLCTWNTWRLPSIVIIGRS